MSISNGKLLEGDRRQDASFEDIGAEGRAWVEDVFSRSREPSRVPETLDGDFAE